MPFTKKNYPKAMKKFSDKPRNKAIQLANAILRVGKLEVPTTISTAISRVKQAIADYNEKRINNVKIHYI